MKKMFLLILFLITLIIPIEATAKGFGIGKITKGVRPNYSDKSFNENCYYIGSDEKSVYLTFDCGYENGYTNSILDTLKKNDVKACFFITGHYLNSSKDIVKKMLDDGHIIGNHTYHHKDFTKESEKSIIEDIKKLEDSFYECFNVNMSKYIRPPKGEYDSKSMRVVKDLGYKSIFWSLAYVDWYKDKYYANDYAYNNVISRMHNGAIILMHTVSKDNMMDLDKIIKKIKNDGYVFKTLDEL